jgi:hypothetical protein
MSGPQHSQFLLCFYIPHPSLPVSDPSRPRQLQWWVLRHCVWCGNWCRGWFGADAPIVCFIPSLDRVVLAPVPRPLPLLWTKEYFTQRRTTMLVSIVNCNDWCFHINFVCWSWEQKGGTGTWAFDRATMAIVVLWIKRRWLSHHHFLLSVANENLADETNPAIPPTTIIPFDGCSLLPLS